MVLILMSRAKSNNLLAFLNDKDLPKDAILPVPSPNLEIFFIGF